MHTPRTKADLRRSVCTLLAAQPSNAFAARSADLTTRLTAHPIINSARTLLAFLPIPGEPAITPFIEHRLAANLPTALPRADWQSATNHMDAVLVYNLSLDCTPARYSILQPRADLLPLALTQLDVVLVPGVAFDPHGARLGRGGGFYDRFLARAKAARPDLLITGICFDEQVVDFVPSDAHDVRVDMILTPTRTMQVA